MNKPLVSALVTVIFSKEDEELVTPEAASQEQSPSPSVNSLQSRLEEDITNAPSQGREGDSQGMARTPRASSQENIMESEPANTHANILYLKLPPGVNPMEVEDGVMVTWERAPDKDNEQGPREPK